MNRSFGFCTLLFCMLVLNACGTHQKTAKSNLKGVEDPALNSGTPALAPCLVYKTKNNYYDRVPVLMNAKRDKIIAYPAPTDLFLGTTLCLPTRLQDGYLLDNRGIGTQVAFLTYTYQNYGALKQAPPMNQLMDSLLDRNPLTELWDCGPRTHSTKEVEELNALIEKGFPNKKALIEVLRVNR